eukprot:6175316-Pleurochrysis_carterae.AAC.2
MCECVREYVRPRALALCLWAVQRILSSDKGTRPELLSTLIRQAADASKSLLQSAALLTSSRELRSQPSRPANRPKRCSSQPPLRILALPVHPKTILPAPASPFAAAALLRRTLRLGSVRRSFNSDESSAVSTCSKNRRARRWDSTWLGL